MIKEAEQELRAQIGQLEVGRRLAMLLVCEAQHQDKRITVRGDGLRT